MRFHRQVWSSALLLASVTLGSVSAVAPLRGAHLRDTRSLQVESPINDKCENATFIQASASSSPILSGSTVGTTSSHVGQLKYHNPVFYKFRGSGARYKVSACPDKDGESASNEFDSALFIIEDSSCHRNDYADYENEHDFDCDPLGLGSTVEFYSKSDIFYTFAVAGVAEEATGNFDLTLQEFVRPQNHECEAAIWLDPSTDGLPVATGSTENATFHSFQNGGGDQRLSVFYKFKGTGGPMKISTCNNATDFDSALVLFNRDFCPILWPHLENDHDFDCDELGLGSTIDFVSVENEIYTLVVRGVHSSDAGNYGLILQEMVRPPNDHCFQPERLELASVSTEVEETMFGNDSTINTQAEESLSGNFTGISEVTTSRDASKTNSTAPSTNNLPATIVHGSTLNATLSEFNFLGPRHAVFYSILGTGQLFRISTCGPNLDFDSYIGISVGICDSAPSSRSLVASSAHDYNCDSEGKAATVEWESEADTIYTVAVRGVLETDRGNFALSLQAFGNPYNETCHWVQVCDDLVN